MTVASSLLLPMPVAVAVPHTVTLTEEVLGVTRPSVTGIGDPATSHPTAPAGQLGQLGHDRPAAGFKAPAVSVTRVGKLAKSGKSVKAQASAIAANGIPAAALRAYRTAEATMNIADPSCGLSWGLLAGIGRIESDHGRFGGAVLADNGISTPHILGLPLNGAGSVSAITDTDNGTLDGDKKWDRAVGPMQFIPSTWAIVGVDGDGNGNRNPNDIDDAALAAAAYLCVGNNDLTTAQGMQTAVYSYNHSNDYVAMVLGVAHAYQNTITNLPLLQATLTLPTGPGTTVGLNTGTGIAIGATDDVSKAGTKKAKQTRRTTDPKAGNKADTKAGDKTDTKPGNKAGDKTDPSDGGQQTPPASGGGKVPTPAPTPGGNPPGDTGGDGGNTPTDPPSTPADPPTGGNDPSPSPSPTPTPDPKPSPSPTPSPTPTPAQDVAEGTLVWCDAAAKDALCLEGQEDAPLDISADALDSYKSLVGASVTVIYGSTDGSLSGAICGIVAGKVDDPKC